MVGPSPRYMPRTPSYLRMFLTVSGERGTARRGRRTLSTRLRGAGGTPLTDYAQVAVVAALDLLGLQLCLDHVERTCGDAGDQATSRASCRPGAHAGSDERAGHIR